MQLFGPEIRDQATRSVLLALDTHWWELRTAFDKYIDAAADHTSAYKHGFSQLDEYTSTCSVGFSGLQQAWAKTQAAEDNLHNVLHETWHKAVPRVGLIVASVVDGDAFRLFARTDAASIDVHSLQSSNLLDICEQAGPHVEDEQKAQTAAQKVIDRTLAMGLVGQTVMQLHIAFDETRILQDWLSKKSGQTPSEASTVEDAKVRFGQTLETLQSTRAALATSLISKVRETGGACDALLKKSV